MEVEGRSERGTETFKVNRSELSREIKVNFQRRCKLTSVATKESEDATVAGDHSPWQYLQPHSIGDIISALQYYQGLD